MPERTPNGSSRRSPALLRVSAILLAGVTGCTALVDEVAWQQYMAVLLGSQAEATATVLAVFLGGLACGYALFGRLSRRIVERATAERAAPRLLLTYGVIEAAIGALTLIFPWTFLAAQRLSPELPRSTEALSFAMDVLLTVALIGPAALLMGGTVPLLTQALSRNVGEATRVHAWVYGINTAGAFVGALAGGFVIVPRLGLAGSVQAMGVVNLTVGLIYVAMSRRAGALDIPRQAARPDAGAPPRLAVYILAAFLGGFALMALQTTLNRFGALALGASQFTFAMVAATFVLCIALGSFGVSLLREVRPVYLVAGQWIVVGYLVACYGVLGDVTYWVHRLRVGFANDPQSFVPYMLTVLLLFALFAVVPLGLSGAALPLIFHQLRRESNALGGVAGRLYGWNTAGSLVGALLGGYALLFWFDLHHVYRSSVLALAVGATLLTLVVFPRRRVMAVAALAIVTLATLWQQPWEPRRLAAGLYRQRTAMETTRSGADAYFARDRKSGGEYDVLSYEDDPSTSVAVIRSRGPEFAQALLLNGKSDGDIPGDNLTTGLLAMLPALFAERTERAFVVGLGAGMTAGVLGTLEETHEVVVAEISPGVVRAAKLFDAVNFHATANSKIDVRRTDAYRELLRDGAAFDVIVSEPSNPWVSGVELLYSLEFLRAARQRLAPGGVYAQWFHTYETNDATVALILATFREAFDRVSVWSPASTDLILLGFQPESRPLDLAALERRFALPDYRAHFKELSIDSLPELLAHEVLPLGVVAEIDLPAETHTILHPLLGHRAARAFYAGGQARLPASHRARAAEVGRQHSLLRRYRQNAGAAYTWEVRSRVLSETCHFLDPVLCATLFAEWRHEDPASERVPILLDAARRDARLQPLLEPKRLASLVRLFDPMTTATPDRELFERFYHHAAPFAPADSAATGIEPGRARGD